MLKPLSLKEVCEASGLSRTLINKEIKKNELKTITIGSRRLVLPAQYNAWFEDKAKRASATPN